MTAIKIYIGSNRGLPNVARSMAALMGRINLSGVPKNRLQIIDAGASDFEYPTLQRMWLDSFTEDFYCLYLHCKGASKSDETQFQNGLAWMHYMSCGVIDNYRQCLMHLERGADLVGSMWYRHFKGNFFWSKSSYLRQLESPYNFITNHEDRLHAEYWCSQSYWYKTNAPQPKVKNLFYLPIKTDNDFLPLLNRNYVPDLWKRSRCTNLLEAKASGNFAIYDDLVVTDEDRMHANAFSNYNSEFYAAPPVSDLPM